LTLNPRQLLIVLAAAILIAAAAVYYFVSRPDAVVISGQTGQTTAPASGQNNSALMVAGPLGEMSLGDPNAPNVVIEYASMTCTHCQRFHAEVYRPFKQKYVDTGKALFILREYPLDPLAAAAVVVARCQPKERFFPLIDLLFDHQQDWAFVPDPVAALRNLVKQAGVSQDAFQACLTNQEILDGVNWVKNRGEKEFGVASTPTFFINGTMFKGEQSLEDLDKALGG
jgi:protein-disulfide isomerase